MAEIALRSIQFPGLDNTYTIPDIQHGDTLPESGTEGQIFLQTGTDSLIDRIGAAPAGYGLGEAVTSDWTNIDNITAPGWYRFALSGGITAGGVTANYAYMHVVSYSSVHATQTLYLVGQKSTLTRQRSSSTWSEWEWENPPMMLNTEYRTTERFKGKAVYTKLLETTLSTAGQTVSVALGVDAITEIADVQILSQTSSGNTYVLPRLSLYTGDPSLTGYVSIANKNIVLRCIDDLSDNVVTIKIKYTKD